MNLKIKIKNLKKFVHLRENPMGKSHEQSDCWGQMYSVNSKCLHDLILFSNSLSFPQSAATLISPSHWLAAPCQAGTQPSHMIGP